ncbi:hypothetical protein BDY21DRAFT_364785 [Lineolata rhizophorae]|uniref:Uncharacterized protein n=1 Tax=Lineolata rhizophorae TaxID=578093 RepID=A0A6A6NX32_9PEZI|nr:hypothetical protein BDY21DRAFT_364785 [Lineolata rhizophorae]
MGFRRSTSCGPGVYRPGAQWAGQDKGRVASAGAGEETRAAGAKKKEKDERGKHQICGEGGLQDRGRAERFSPGSQTVAAVRAATVGVVSIGERPVGEALSASSRARRALGRVPTCVRTGHYLWPTSGSAGRSRRAVAVRIARRAATAASPRGIDLDAGAAEFITRPRQPQAQAPAHASLKGKPPSVPLVGLPAPRESDNGRGNKNQNPRRDLSRWARSPSHRAPRWQTPGKKKERPALPTRMHTRPSAPRSA